MPDLFVVRRRRCYWEKPDEMEAPYAVAVYSDRTAAEAAVLTHSRWYARTRRPKGGPAAPQPELGGRDVPPNNGGDQGAEGYHAQNVRGGEGLKPAGAEGGRHGDEPGADGVGHDPTRREATVQLVDEPQHRELRVLVGALGVVAVRLLEADRHLAFLHRHVRARERELAEGVHAARFPVIEEVGRLEVLHLAGDVDL